MAKNRNKKQRNGAVSMDTTEQVVFDVPQAMDTSETGANKAPSGALSRKIKGRPMKRTKNVRKMKSIAKAISQNEKVEKKVKENESKIVRVQTAKKLYD